MTWHLAPLRARDPRETKAEATVFLKSRAITYVILLLITNQPLSVGGTTRRYECQPTGILKAFWEAGYHGGSDNNDE